jgi:hypothetical protein
MKSSIILALCALVLPTAGVAHASPCDAAMTYCIDTDGMAVGETSNRFHVGDKIVVHVYGTPLADGETVSLEARATRSRNSLLARDSDASLFAEDADVRPAPGAEPIREVVWQQTIEVANARSMSLIVTKSLSNGRKELGTAELAIERGVYYARAGLAFYWVPEGQREITPDHVVIEDAARIPGVALSFWPWGHREGSLSAFEGFRIGKRARDWKPLRDLVFLQVGTHLDLTKPFERMFVGAGIEPIAGLGISSGIAAVTGTYFTGAAADQERVTTDRWMVRGYIALNITSELLGSLEKLIDGKD